MTDPAREPGHRHELAAYLAEFGERLDGAAPRTSDGAPDVTPAAVRGRRWRRPLVAATGLAVAGLAAAFVVAPAVTPVDPVSEARAALGDAGDLVHFVVRMSDGARPDSDSPCMQRGPTEVWQATSGTPRWRVIQPGMSKRCGTMMTWDGARIRGPIEMARDGDTQTTWYPQMKRLEVLTETGFAAEGDYPARLFGGPEPARSAATGDPIARLRALLDQGTLRQDRSGRLAGREVVHLVGATSKEGGDSESRYDLAVDAHTFVPVRFTTRYRSDFQRLNPDVTNSPDGWATWTTDFLVYDQRPMTSEAARDLTIRPKSRPKTEFRFTKAEFERRARAGSKR